MTENKEIEKLKLDGMVEEKKTYERVLLEEGNLYYGVIKGFEPATDADKTKILKSKSGRQLAWLKVAILGDIAGENKDIFGKEISSLFTIGFSEGLSVIKDIYMPLKKIDHLEPNTYVNLEELVGMPCKFIPKTVESKKDATKGQKFSVLDKVFPIKESEAEMVNSLIQTLKEINSEGKQ